MDIEPIVIPKRVLQAVLANFMPEAVAKMFTLDDGTLNGRLFPGQPNEEPVQVVIK